MLNPLAALLASFPTSPLEAAARVPSAAVARVVASGGEVDSATESRWRVEVAEVGWKTMRSWKVVAEEEEAVEAEEGGGERVKRLAGGEEAGVCRAAGGGRNPLLIELDLGRKTTVGAAEVAEAEAALRSEERCASLVDLDKLGDPGPSCFALGALTLAMAARVTLRGASSLAFETFAAKCVSS